MPPAPIDHSIALSLLMTRLRRPLLEGLMSSYLSAIQTLEDETVGLSAGLVDLDSAVGDVLRLYARLVGAQIVVDDEVQRLLIRVRIRVLRSRGTPEDLIEIMGFLAPAAAIYLQELPPASILVGTLYSLDPLLLPWIATSVRRARPAGVGAAVLWTPATEAETLRLAEGCAAAGAGTPLASYAAVAGASPDLLWGGSSLADLVVGSDSLSPTGTAGVVERYGVVAAASACEYGTSSLALGSAGTLDGSTAVMRADVTSVIVVAYRLATADTTGVVVGTRPDAAPGEVGWELALTASGAEYRIDDGIGTSTAVFSARARRPGWQICAARLAYGPPVVGQVAIGYETGAVGTAQSIASADPLSIGAYDPADVEVRLLAYHSTTVPADAQVLARALEDAIRALENASDPARALDDASSPGAGGSLVGVVDA